MRVRGAINGKTTISKPSKGSRLRGPLRSREGDYLKRRRDPRPQMSKASWTRSIAYDGDSTIQEGKPSEASYLLAFASGIKVAVPVLLGLIPLAVVCGAIATGKGLSALEALALSVFFLSGAAQLSATQLIADGASVPVIILTVLIISLRLTMYSASLAPHFRRLSAGWKGMISYLLTDPAYAVTIARFDDGETKEPDKRWYFLGVALAIWMTWLLGTMMGVFLGAWVPESLSLDFVLHLTFIALALPAIKDYTTTAAALSAGIAAVVVATLPLNLGLITAAVVGVLGGLVAEGVAESRWK
jgi:4-azaleucine resistance transporter AzlC